MKNKISRRRAIKIISMGFTGALYSKSVQSAQPRQNEISGIWHNWEGEVLGASASIALNVPNLSFGKSLVSKCIKEFQRLESYFSLYHSSSLISQLNKEGFLQNPPEEMVELLQIVAQIHSNTNGAFDASVQPLWKLYSTHYFNQKRKQSSKASLQLTKGPGAEQIAKAAALVDQTAVNVSEKEIRFDKKGMAITLNGIAQGFITDKIIQLLKTHGIKDVMVDLGEISVLGRDKNAPWKVGILNPLNPMQIALEIELEDQALSSSGGYGLAFDKVGKVHHIFDPKTGKSSQENIAVSVVAPTAAVADGLSTGFSSMNLKSIELVLANYKNSGALVTAMDGSIKLLGEFPNIQRIAQ